MAVSQSWKDKDLEDLYKYSWFFGELSEENAKEILSWLHRFLANSFLALNSVLNQQNVLFFFSNQLYFKANIPDLNTKNII